MGPNIPLLRRWETWRSYCKVTCGRESNMLWVMVVDVSRSESLNSYPQVLPLLSQNCGIFHVYLYMCIYIYIYYILYIIYIYYIYLLYIYYIYRYHSCIRIYSIIQYMHVCAKNLYISSGFAQMITSCLQGVQGQGLATFEPTRPLDHRSAKRLMFHPRGPNFRLSCCQ